MKNPSNGTTKENENTDKEINKSAEAPTECSGTQGGPARREECEGTDNSDETHRVDKKGKEDLAGGSDDSMEDGLELEGQEQGTELEKAGNETLREDK